MVVLGWNLKSVERRKENEPVNGQPGVFKQTTIGGLYTVHPNQSECFFLGILLINVPGSTSFQQ
ncbi:unnamed protein product [Onchocerca flexuosa]|uniref:Uncharacterized protein n=1 Tax=Onchocerca flexuosa TaxID=387005 RepID=A0A3P7WPI0_9BILA|nr:unnamed protein product [Onchocerca flexuosa]